MGANACAGGASTTARRVSILNWAARVLFDRAHEGLAQRHRTDLERLARRRRTHDRGIAQAFHQRAPDARLRRRHEAEPQPRQPRCQHRHRYQEAPQAAQPRVLAHHLAVGDHLGSADFEYALAPVRQVERRPQIRQHIVNRDRLGARVDPSGADHHRQPLDQRADHLERQAAGSDDDRGAELDDRYARFAQRLSRFQAALQMCRQGIRVVAESSEIDDAAHAGPGGGAAEVGGGLPIERGKAGAARHRVHQVIGLIHPVHGRDERRFVETISRDDLGGGPSRGDALGLPREAPHRAAAFLEHSKKAAADVSAGAGEQDHCGHGRSIVVISSVFNIVPIRFPESKKAPIGAGSCEPHGQDGLKFEPQSKTVMLSSPAGRLDDTRAQAGVAGGSAAVVENARRGRSPCSEMCQNRHGLRRPRGNVAD